MHKGNDCDHLPLLKGLIDASLEVQLLEEDGPVPSEREPAEPATQVLEQRALPRHRLDAIRREQDL